MSAQRALNRIAESPKGAQAVVDAEVFGPLPELFNSLAGGIRKGTAELLGILATHDFGLKRLLNSTCFTQLASLLRRVRIQFTILVLDTDHQTAMTRN